MAQKEILLQMDILAASKLKSVGNNTWVEMHLLFLGPFNSNHIYFTSLPTMLFFLLPTSSGICRKDKRKKKYE